MDDQQTHDLMTLGDDRGPTADEFRRFKRRFRLIVGGLAGMMLAINVAPVAASHLNVKTSDINNGAVTTPKLADGAVREVKIFNGAVSTPKLRNDAVTGPKIKNRAVGSQKIARGVPGIAVAGAYINSGGGVTFNWFNRFGGAPTVNKIGTGMYDVLFPGLEGKGQDAIVAATIQGSTPGMITHQDIPNGVRIVTFGAAGTLADSAFHVTIMKPRP